MTEKLNKYLLAGMILLLISWLFTGIYRDDEFYEPDIFIKYRPTFKMMFYSPIGMQDLDVNDLSAELQKEEIAFQEFVVQHRSFHHGFQSVLLVLMQLALTFFTFGMYRLWKNTVYRKWQLPVHFLINLVFLFVGIGNMLFQDKCYITILLTSAILSIQFLTLVILTRTKT